MITITLNSKNLLYSAAVLGIGVFCLVLARWDVLGRKWNAVEYFMPCWALYCILATQLKLWRYSKEDSAKERISASATVLIFTSIMMLLRIYGAKLIATFLEVDAYKAFFLMATTFSFVGWIQLKILEKAERKWER